MGWCYLGAHCKASRAKALSTFKSVLPQDQAKQGASAFYTFISECSLPQSHDALTWRDRRKAIHLRGGIFLPAVVLECFLLAQHAGAQQNTLPGCRFNHQDKGHDRSTPYSPSQTLFRDLVPKALIAINSAVVGPSCRELGTYQCYRPIFLT